MLRRRWMIPLGLVGVVGLAVAWYLFRPDRAFTNRTVDESFPVSASGAAQTTEPDEMMMEPTATAAMAAEEMMEPTATAAMAAKEMMEPTAAMDDEMMEPTATAAMDDEMMMEPTAEPTAIPTPTTEPQPIALAMGEFHDVVHEGRGTATIYQLPDGRRILRLTDFRVLDGPDLYVYLSAATDAQDSASITSAGFVSLGELKGNQGNQNYEIPAEVDLSQLHSVSIWCKRFSVNFATAPLT